MSRATISATTNRVDVLGNNCLTALIRDILIPVYELLLRNPDDSSFTRFVSSASSGLVDALFMVMLMSNPNRLISTASSFSYLVSLSKP